MPYLAGGASYPLASPGVGGDLLALASPFSAKALDFWEAVINAYLSTAYVAAMAGQATVACAETGSLAPGEWMLNSTFRFPYLAMWPLSSASTELTQQHNIVTTRYQVVYALPALSTQQAARVLPILEAVYRLLVGVTERQSDPAYEDEEQVWMAAGTTSVVMGAAVYDFLELSEKKLHKPLPALIAEVTATEKVAWDYSVGAETFVDTDLRQDFSPSEDPADAELGVLADVVVSDIDIPA